MAGEQIEGCTGQQIEEFLWKSRVFVMQLVPEPDDFDLVTAVGFVSRQWMCDGFYMCAYIKYITVWEVKILTAYIPESLEKKWL